MNWTDLKTNDMTEDDINWMARYDYIRKNMDELGYILGKCRAKKVGKLFVSKCPFPHHNEKTGSFTIYNKDHLDRYTGKPQGKVTFYCFGCGCGGDIIKFYQYYNSLPSKRDACVALEKELDIDINDKDIQQELLKDSFSELMSSEQQTLDFNSVNMICAKICREYLNFVKNNYKKQLKSEFSAIQHYLNEYDEEIMDMVAGETYRMIDKTNDVIDMRKNNLIKGEDSEKTN